MSGIVGSRFNIRGSGLVGRLGTDGQVFTSSGAGSSAVYEAAAGGGKVLQCVGNSIGGAGANQEVTTETPTATGIVQAITPTSATNRILIMMDFSVVLYDVGGNSAGGGIAIYRDIGGAGFTNLDTNKTGNIGSAANEQIYKTYDDLLCYTRYQLQYWDASYDSTSECTYKLYIAEMQSNDNYFNVGAGSGLVSTVLMEIDES